MKPAPSAMTKTYPPRGPLQQFRFAESAAFNCFRCGQAKQSKLITIYRGDWSRRLCGTVPLVAQVARLPAQGRSLRRRSNPSAF